MSRALYPYPSQPVSKQVWRQAFSRETAAVPQRSN